MTTPMQRHNEMKNIEVKAKAAYEEVERVKREAKAEGREKSSNPEIRPCPLCGGKLEIVDSDIEFPDGDVLLRHISPDCPFEADGENGQLWSRDALVDLLNTRPIEDAQQKEIERLTAELAKLRKATEWIKVSERLPEADKSMPWFSVEVLVLNGDEIERAWYHLKSHEWMRNGEDLHHVTHWQPLPPTPEPDEVQP